MEYAIVLGVYSILLWVFFTFRTIRQVQSYEVIDGKLSNIREMHVKPHELHRLLKLTADQGIEPLKLYLIEMKNGNYLFNANLIVRFPLNEAQKQQRELVKMKRKDGA